jgi:hypothetical protein
MANQLKLARTGKSQTSDILSQIADIFYNL